MKLDDEPIFLTGLQFMQVWTATTGDGVARKIRKKMKTIEERYIERTQGKKVSINSRRKVI